MPKFRVSLFSLALMLAVPFAPQAVAKTAAATTASQPEIASGSAMIVDLNTNKVIYSNHPDLVRPIASISKLMTAMVVLDARLPLDEKLKVDISQTPEMKGVYSRVRLNSEISRKDMLLLALMSSENRAAASLAHHYPGGYKAFIKAMNAKAKSLGMNNTRFVEPTGLSVHNRRHLGGFLFFIAQRCCRHRHHFTGFNPGTQAAGIGKMGIFAKRVHHYQRHRFIIDNRTHHQTMARRIGKAGFG